MLVPAGGVGVLGGVGGGGEGLEDGDVGLRGGVAKEGRKRLMLAGLWFRFFGFPDDDNDDGGFQSEVHVCAGFVFIRRS